MVAPPAGGAEVPPGTIVGVFVLYYGIARWLSDSLRVNDERVAGMTGAQWMCLVMIPAGLWILWKVRPRLAAPAAPRRGAEGRTPTDAEEADDADGEDGGRRRARTTAADADGRERRCDDADEAGRSPTTPTAATAPSTGAERRGDGPAER